MNVLVIGSGGREHALVYRLASDVEQVYCFPGNPGIGEIAINVEENLNDYSLLKTFCNEKKIDLVVVGPEIPLVEGIADYLRENNIAVFGPSKAAAQIEGDKAFSKALMEKYNIPTAAYKSFGVDQFVAASEYIKNGKLPVVIKASGLAAGKGVAICDDTENALEELKACMLDGKFGSAGEQVVIEEFMVGEEASVFAITDGSNFVTLPASQDHKRAYDNDEGPNTGGMGAYAPAPVIDEALQSIINEKIITPTLEAMKSEGMPYSGCLYCGLMITSEGPKVVEFNCRFGDPETQVVLPLLEGDFAELLLTSANGKLNTSAVKYNNRNAVCVVAASAGYPGSYEKGKVITGLENHEESVIIYHAGTKENNGEVKTSGGRVLGVTAITDGNELKKSVEKAYAAISKISFDGITYRNDIAAKAFK